MIFGDTPTNAAAGAILAHSLRVGETRLRKGRVLDDGDIAALIAAGIESVVTARLEDSDVGEDRAAETIARAAAGSGDELRQAPPFTGRCNLFAKHRGLALVERGRIEAINAVDEAITLATVTPYALLQVGDMAATVKIIPFALPEAAVREAERIATDGGPLVALAPLVAKRYGLIQTTLPGTKPRLLDKTERVTRARLEALNGTLAADARCGHTVAEASSCLRARIAEGCDIVLLIGASAIADRRDVIPCAIEAAGGTVEHFGMPVDPGNLLLLGSLDGHPVVGLPGCARSAKANGADWVLQRLAAEIPIGRAEITRMGTGGLIGEIGSRPQPRAGVAHIAPARAPRVAALLLAAGQSRRMGPANKLLADIDGAPMVARVADALLASQASPVIAVTGHDGKRVGAALAGKNIEIVDNPDFADGLATSLRAGLAALPDDVDAALVCLGDMPLLAPAHINLLIGAFEPADGREICVPCFHGKRGNPVLWGSRFFAEMADVQGDVGARHLIGAHAEASVEVAMPDAGVLTDVDTPAALAAARGVSESRGERG